MVESVGKKLSQARLKRGLTIEEVAHTTKLRPDKIIALENDDYSSFPSNVYAKGFLQIYGRFLKVDVSEFLQSLESSNSISIEDYQYLNNAPIPKHHSAPARRERRPPSVAPLVFFVLIVFVGLFTTWVIVTYNRTVPSTSADKEENGQSSSGTASNATPAPASSSGKTGATPSPVVVPQSATPAPRPTAPISPAPIGSVALNSGAVPSSTPVVVPTPRIAPSALSDHDFMSQATAGQPTPNPVVAQHNPVNEVLVASVKTTWVTIRKDDPNAKPIYQDYLYPNANPLKLKGARFFIDATDPSAVQITKNGQPFAYQAPNVPVQ